MKWESHWWRHGWQASLSTQASQWWAAVPSVTASIVFLCSAVYAVSLVFGYDAFDQVCILPYKLVEHFQGMHIAGFVTVTMLFFFENSEYQIRSCSFLI
jgi:hypothetical protein